MAVKKSKPAEAAAPTSPAKKAAPKKAAAPAVAAKPKAAAPAVATDTASKASTPKPPATPKAPAAAPKKAAPAIKLTENQLSFLKQIQTAAEAGYLSAKKAEAKTIDKLVDHKLIKKGSKDKDSGAYRYMVSKAGEKYLSTLPTA